MAIRMNGEPIKILLVEDDLGDSRLLREALSEAVSARFELIQAERLDKALEFLAEKSFDVVLLDLSLPDEHGLDTLLRVREHSPEVPIIVLTGMDDEEVSLKAVQAGAQDYLIKGQVDTNLLWRSMRYTIERQRLQKELEQARRREQHEQELRSLEQLSSQSQTSVSAQMFGLLPLNRSTPEKFNELVQHYGNLMDLALEERAYKVDHNLAESLRAVAEQLGFLKAGPRDVVEIHRTGLRRKLDATATPQKAQAYVEEGRLLVLELMGYLVSYYRNYSMGTRGNNISAAHKGKENET